jgi:hypothetical protein
MVASEAEGRAEALRRIAVCRTAQAEELDLGGLQLTALDGEPAGGPVPARLAATAVPRTERRGSRKAAGLDGSPAKEALEAIELLTLQAPWHAPDAVSQFITQAVKAWVWGKIEASLAAAGGLRRSAALGEPADLPRASAQASIRGKESTHLWRALSSRGPPSVGKACAYSTLAEVRATRIS